MSKFDVLYPYSTAASTAPAGHGERLLEWQREHGIESPADQALVDLTWVITQTRKRCYFNEPQAAILVDVVRKMFVLVPQSADALYFEVEAYLQQWASGDIVRIGGQHAGTHKKLLRAVKRMSPVERLVVVRLAQSAIALERLGGITMDVALRMVGLAK